MRGVAAALILGLAAAAGPAEAQEERIGWATADELTALTASCPSAQMPPGARASARAMHVPDPTGYVLRQLGLMLRADPALCPGIAAAAAERVRTQVGDPERPDVSIGFLELARLAAEEGLGMPADRALADRLGRIQWLFAYEDLHLPRWTAAQQQAWLARPETVALLEGRAARNPHATRQQRMLAELRLRRDVAGYNPEEALRLFDQAVAFERYAEVLTDGEHMPPDYRRAFAPMFRLGMFSLDDDQQRLLLRVGRQAAARARTPEERAQALRILFAGAVDDFEGGCRFVASQLRHFRDAPTVPFAPEDARRIQDRMGSEYDPMMVSDEPAEPRPIVLRALIDPAGRLIYAEVRQSSGSRDRDFYPVQAWATYAEEVDLSATSRGRFVWTELPPIPPERTTYLEGGRTRSTCG
ncbi:MAG TPA: hypothetical protein VF704_03345 [Allosphingosinicella sp.]